MGVKEMAPEHNYIKKLAEVWNQEEHPPDLYDAFVAHDRDCAIHGGRHCDCDPAVSIVRRAVQDPERN
jgi:hypothetical protein